MQTEQPPAWSSGLDDADLRTLRLVTEAVLSYFDVTLGTVLAPSTKYRPNVYAARRWLIYLLLHDLRMTPDFVSAFVQRPKQTVMPVYNRLRRELRRTTHEKYNYTTLRQMFAFFNRHCPPGRTETPDWYAEPDYGAAHQAQWRASREPLTLLRDLPRYPVAAPPDPLVAWRSVS